MENGQKRIQSHVDFWPVCSGTFFQLVNVFVLENGDSTQGKVV